MFDTFISKFNLTIEKTTTAVKWMVKGWRLETTAQEGHSTFCLRVTVNGLSADFLQRTDKFDIQQNFLEKLEHLLE